VHVNAFLRSSHFEVHMYVNVLSRSWHLGAHINALTKSWHLDIQTTLSYKVSMMNTCKIYSKN
jgi:hypothetical protein